MDGGGVEDTGLYFCHEVGHVIAGGVAGVDDEAGVLLRHLCAAHRQPLQAALVDEGGGIMPLGGKEEISGGHKRYGYGMLVEIFCSILSGGCTSNHTFTGGKTGICHSFIAIDPDIFGSADEIKEHFSSFLNELRCLPLAEGADRIYTHGEKEAEAMRFNMENGIPVSDATLGEMAEIGKLHGLNLEDYLGDLTGKTKAAETFY